MTERLAHDVGPDRLTIAYGALGSPDHPPVLLLMGIAAQLISWPAGFLDALVARDLQVICMDNRDSGHSTHMTGAPPADLPAVLGGALGSVTYTLSHMAADAVGLIDALGHDAVHLVGASMGAAIAQTIAIDHPARVRSLTSMMFTTGAPGVGLIHPDAAKELFAGPPATTRDAHIARMLRARALVGSPAWPFDPDEVARIAGLCWDRDHDDAAIARQAVATVASGDRTADLGSVRVPTLVVHGLADRMSDSSGGRATAAAIPGAELLLIEGMGHDLPAALWPRLADAVARTVQRGEAAA
ncbi:MAG: alpha/beta fold hydrolase [Alphaproteobacteria bacterium]|nr:alpha/beta fold hydrolase [Alphaproteobacteria bacterium]